MKHLGLVILLISMSACSSSFPIKSDREDKTLQKPMADANTKTPDAPELSPEQMIDDTKPLTDNIASPIIESPQEPEIVDVTLNKHSYLDSKYSEEDKTESVSEKPEIALTKSTTVHPAKALKWLKNGNKRFLKGTVRKDGQSKKDIKRLSHGENPHAIVFASSDSRISPEIIFDEKLGEIHVVRNLALAVGPEVLNSIDYAVGDLGTRLLIILDRSYPNKKIDFSHADQVTQKLVDQSQVLKAGLEMETLTIVPAVYDIETGKVTFGK